MTLLTNDAGVLPLQKVARLAVIESLLRGLPMNHLKVFAVMVRMAADAILAARLKIDDSGVKSPMGGQSRGYFRVALQALQTLASHRQPVTRNALSGTIKGLMSTRKGAGGNLGTRTYSE